MKLIILLSFLIQVILNIQTTILEYLTRSDQQTLIVAKQIFNIIQTQKYFKKEPFTCLALIPSNLTKNHKQKVFKLNITYNYNNQQTHKSQTTNNINNKQIQTIAQNDQNKQIIGFYEDYDYDKILDLLHGTCAIHQTNQFLYEYCHKEKVRQFDNVYTVQRMGKPAYQDIAMGFYNYQQALQKSKSQKDKSLKSEKGTHRIKYSQNGELTILNKFISNIPDLSQNQKQFLTKTLKQTMIGKSTAGKPTLGSDGKATASVQPQVIVHTIPSRSVIYDKNNLFTVDDVNHLEFELNRQDKVIHLNYPIAKGNQYFTRVQFTHEVTCENYEGDAKSVYVAKAVVISIFDLAFLGDINKCDKLIDVSLQPIQKKAFTAPFYIDRFRQVQDFLFGYVDQFCTNNWDWNMNKQNDFLKQRQNVLQPGNTIWVELIANVSGSLIHAYESLTIKKVIAPGVVKTKQNVRQKLKNFKTKVAKSHKDTVWLNTCRIISKNPVNTQKIKVHKIVRKNIIKIGQFTSPNQMKPGNQLVCLCHYKKYNQEFLEMQLTLGNKILTNNENGLLYDYFEFYEKRTVKTSTPNDQNLYSLCEAFICYDVLPNKETLQEQKKQQSSIISSYFTQISKLTYSEPQLIKDFDTQHRIIIIDVSQKGMLKIHTTQYDQKYIYLVSTTMLFKIKLYQNGTKQIIRQNSYYQNQTTLNYVSWYGNSIFIHKNYIWRGNDRIIFPRMNMGTQKITKIQRISGYAFIRQWDLSKMNHYDSLYLSKITKNFQNHYRIKKYPIYKSQQSQNDINTKIQIDQTQNMKNTIQATQIKGGEQPIQLESQISEAQKIDYSKIDFKKSQYKALNKSVSVRYQYFHGDYCGQPINKYRRTNVDLQCGEPWLKIQQVKQTSPCIYELKVSTRLLCRQEYSKTIDKIQLLNKSIDNRIRLQKGLLCYPQDAWDNALYVYDVEQKDVYLSIK